MNAAVRIGEGKGRTAVFWHFHFYRNDWQCLLQDCVNHRLVILDAIVDDVIQAVIVLDIHAIEIVAIRVIRQLLNAAHGLDSGEIHAQK